MSMLYNDIYYFINQVVIRLIDTLCSPDMIGVVLVPAGAANELLKNGWGLVTAFSKSLIYNDFIPTIFIPKSDAVMYAEFLALLIACLIRVFLIPSSFFPESSNTTPSTLVAPEEIALSIHLAVLLIFELLIRI